MQNTAQLACPVCEHRIKSGTTDGLRQHLYSKKDCLAKSNFEDLEFSDSDKEYLKKAEAYYENQYKNAFHVSPAKPKPEENAPMPTPMPAASLRASSSVSTNSDASGLVEHLKPDVYGDGYAAGYQIGYERGLQAGRLAERAARPAGFSLTQEDGQKGLTSSRSSSSSHKAPSSHNKAPATFAAGAGS